MWVLSSRCCCGGCSPASMAENPYMTESHQFGIDPKRLELWIPNRASTRGGAGAVVPLFSGSRCTGSLT